MLVLPDEQIEALKARAASIPHPREMIIDALRAVQSAHGWVPDEGVELVAGILGLSALQIEEVATFYDKIYRRPVGRKVIHVCDSICCWSRGGEQVMEHLQEALGIAPGGTSDDGVFTLLPTCCLGACGEAPAMMVGLRIYGHLTPERIDAILAEERALAADKD